MDSCSHARARGLDPEPEVCVSRRNRSERRSPTRPAPALRSQTWPAISRNDWLGRDAATGRAERHPHARPRDHLVACDPRAATTRGSRAPSRVRANRTSRANTQPLIKKLTTTASAADRPGGETLPRGIGGGARPRGNEAAFECDTAKTAWPAKALCWFSGRKKK